MPEGEISSSNLSSHVERPPGDVIGCSRGLFLLRSVASSAVLGAKRQKSIDCAILLVDTMSKVAPNNKLPKAAEATSSGADEQAVASGVRSLAYAGRNKRQAVASGESCRAAATESMSQAIAAGNSAFAENTGRFGLSAASGNTTKVWTGNFNSIAAVIGDNSRVSASHPYSIACATGTRNHASTIGSQSVAACTSAYCKVESAGPCSIAVAGHNGMAKAGPRSAIAIMYYNGSEDSLEMKIAATAASKEEATGAVLKPYTWYCLDRDGNFVEVPDKTI